jgi:glycosyltransferase involved in cell wall biosynthesis
MPEVMKKFPQAKLVIAGNGTERAFLEGLRSQLGLSDKVVFLGRKTPGEIRTFLREISLFVLASNWEGFGLAAVEAMASGIPVVATRVGGLLEIVEEGKTGFLVPPDEPLALAHRIICLLKNRDLRVEMGRAGRKRVETLFSLDTMMVKLETMYRDLLN